MNCMTDCIAGSQYIPSIEYFAHWLHHGMMVLEAHEHFQKKTWRNKTAILGPEYPVMLSVPLRSGKNHRMPIREVEISYDEPWHTTHFRSFQASYGKTAFFEELESDIRSILFARHALLWELNLEMINFIVSYLPGRWGYKFSNQFRASENLIEADFRKGIAAGTSSILQSAIPIYPQVHRLGKPHQPNLSILDVLCHLGPGTIDYLSLYAIQLYRHTS